MSLKEQLEATDRLALASVTKRDEQARDMITATLRNAIAMYVAFHHQPDDVTAFRIEFSAWPELSSAYGVELSHPIVVVGVLPKTGEPI